MYEVAMRQVDSHKHSVMSEGYSLYTSTPRVFVHSDMVLIGHVANVLEKCLMSELITNSICMYKFYMYFMVV